MMTHDRRRYRSANATEAMSLQLRACSEDARLDVMVLTDDTGLPLAAFGPDAETCEEIAATLPILGRKAGDFDGVLLGRRRGMRTMMQRFRFDDAELYLCAIGGHDDLLRARQIARSIRGCARILSAPAAA